MACITFLLLSMHLNRNLYVRVCEGCVCVCACLGSAHTRTFRHSTKTQIMTNTGIINQTLIVYKLDIHEIEVEETLAATLQHVHFRSIDLRTNDTPSL